MTEEPDERQPPQLQDTTERDALPVPLPGDAPEAEDSAATWAPPEAPAAETPAPVEEPEPVEAPAPVEEPDPEPDPEPEPTPEPEPVPEPPPAAATGNGAGGGHDSALPPFEPAPSVAGIGAAEGEGPPLEVLVGAAFLGGIALAFLIKRLGS